MIELVVTEQQLYLSNNSYETLFKNKKLLKMGGNKIMKIIIYNLKNITSISFNIKIFYLLLMGTKIYASNRTLYLSS